MEPRRAARPAAEVRGVRLRVEGVETLEVEGDNLG